MKISRPLAVAAVVATAITLGALPSVARTEPDASGTLPAGMLAALRRDLKLDDSRIATRLRAEAAASTVEETLRTRLGSAFAGAWIPTGATTLTVGVTDASAAETVRAAGATPQVVRRSADDLTQARTRLDRNAADAATSIHGWYVDEPANRVVILAAPGTEASAQEFAQASDAGPVTVLPSAERPRPYYDIRGGDQYATSGNLLCSVGFSVTGGFVTAGHCGQPGITTQGFNSVAQGTFEGSSFPENDYGWVSTNADWTPQPWVNDYAGGNVLVAGSQDAVIGSAVCRSGRTTGWRCGTLLGRDETVAYAEGAVSGLSRSDACAEPGDSGGAWLAGDQAQGVTSGGAGNCTDGAIMWFQPVNEILEVYGLTLTTNQGQ